MSSIILQSETIAIEWCYQWKEIALKKAFPILGLAFYINFKSIRFLLFATISNRTTEVCWDSVN